MRIQFRLGSAVVATMPILALAILSGCSTKPVQPPSAKEQISVWLTEAPRTLRLDIDAELPDGRIRARDEQTDRKIAKVAEGALAGAGMMVLCGCEIGAAGCVLGLVASPAGAVYGAVAAPQTVKPIDVFHPATAISGAPEVLGELRGQRIDLPSLLAERFRAPAAKSGRHTLVGAGVPNEGTLSAFMDEVALSADIREPTRFGLVLSMRVSAEVKSGEETPFAAYWGSFRYESGRRAPLSEWMRDDARRLREETVAALDAMATQFFVAVENTGKDPATRAAVKRWWRSKP